MPLHQYKAGTIRRGAICAALAALLLPGCGGYLSGQWPNLAEGFEDAAERDEALADTEAAQEAAPEPHPVPAPPLPEMTISQETLTDMTARLDEAAALIAEARQAYEAARAAFLAKVKDGAQVDARGEWLTAQLKLTALSRSGDGLPPLLQDLRPVAQECRPEDGAGDEAPVCELSRRAEDTAASLADYLEEERRFLTAQDPAGAP